jgi:glycosyltransferase involved in cell wall biosynthesis
MMRLCSIQPVAERGGSDQALLRMLRSLPSAEFECHVVVPSEPPLRSEYEAAGATVHIVPMRRISTSHGIGAWLAYFVSWPITVVRLTHLVRHLHADVVHTNSLHSWYGWAVARFARRPHVWHAREIVVQSGVALRVERFLARHAARVVCGSQAIADQLDPRNTVVVYDAPDPAVFSPRNAGRFRASRAIPDDVTVAGAVGRFDTWKGLDVLLDAWPRAKQERGDLHLVVAGAAVQGKEQYARDLETRAEALPDVHWLGTIDEEAVADLLADLDVLVAPSTEPEPYGLSLAEALTSGTPVVATDAGGPREIVAAATPGSGRLVPIGNASALAAAIVAIVSAAEPTSTAARAARRPLLELPPGDMAAVFRGLARQPGEPGPGATK